MISNKKSRPSQKQIPSKAASQPRHRRLGCLDQTTNQRLNTLYQKFISKHRQPEPYTIKRQSSESSSNLMREEHSPADEDGGYLNRCQISIDRDISIEKTRMRFQDVVERALQNYETATSQYMQFINEKLSDQVNRMRAVQQLTTRAQQMIGGNGLKSHENKVLRQLNRELESRIISLEGQISTLKANKELSGLRSTLQKVRQNNSIRQRNPTPGKDSRFEIQKKLLLKQNLQLKRQLQSVKKQYEFRLQQISCLSQNNQKQYEDNDEKQEAYKQIVERAQNLQTQLQTMEFEIERMSKVIYELQEQNKTLKNRPQQEDKQYRMKYEVTKNDLEAKTDMWRKRLESRDAELEQSRNRFITIQNELQLAKKENIHWETQETHSRKEIQSLQEEIRIIKDHIQDKKKGDQDVPANKKQDHKDVELHQLHSQIEKLVQENSKLQGVISSLSSKVTETDALKTQNALYKQMLKSQKQKSIPKSSLIEAIKKVINIQPPKLKQSTQINRLLMQLYEQFQKSKEEMLDQELQLKQLRLHKNRIDHILHEQEEGNEFETTHLDAHFYRARPTTDKSVKEQMKKMAMKLDHELTANIEANQQIKNLKGRVRNLEENEIKTNQHLRAIVDDELPQNSKEEHLSGLLQWLGLDDLLSIYRHKLFSL